ncbi:cupin domain-containing protein [Cryptosporangium phraense]|uniref:Cupin domain-containing protein n=1 Tax=Cryptosporangium phraense TaxID=2593070 RepID=A0A545AEG0_9ACTN|nr:cupin domain-containing protein [Cryptosporangium phraense]TQS39699.1 cupin domain-containing protein [Cryptosporangium phraense]
MTDQFWFLGGKARILIPGEATHGAISVMEFADTEKHAPPLHIHDNEDEIWTVLDGEISFFVGDDRYDLEPGNVALGPRGVPHAYLVRSPLARMAVSFAPAGLEKWFSGNSSPVITGDDVPAPFDIGSIVAAAEAYQLRVAGPPPVS